MLNKTLTTQRPINNKIEAITQMPWKNIMMMLIMRTSGSNFYSSLMTLMRHISDTKKKDEESLALVITFVIDYAYV